MKTKIGDTASLSKIITQEDVETYAHISNDSNPIHLDQSFAERSIFGKRIAHGMLVGGLISGVIGTKLPGPGTIYLSQTMKFKKPVFFGDTISALIKVTDIREDKPIITLDTQCINQNNEVVIEGEAIVMLPVE
jgi:3-hydroxybutyryl-CoA dehydratase